MLIFQLPQNYLQKRFKYRMSEVISKRRLTKEFQKYLKSPIPCVKIAIQDDDVYKWYFLIHSIEEEPFTGGEYVGMLTFKTTYPFTPPALQMLTPNGLFGCKTNICTSFTNHHPESWAGAQTIESLLIGFVSMWTTNELSDTLGSINTRAEYKKMLAKESTNWNITNINTDILAAILD